MREAPWNRCDVCGRFILLADFMRKDRPAIRRLLTPDSEFSRETFETLCPAHSVSEGGDPRGKEEARQGGQEGQEEGQEVT